MGKAPLSRNLTGSDGQSPAMHPIICKGSKWLHLATQGAYVVVGWSWDAERDLWMVKYEADAGMHRDGEIADDFTRSIPNFLSKFIPRSRLVDPGQAGEAMARRVVDSGERPESVTESLLKQIEDAGPQIEIRSYIVALGHELDRRLERVEHIVAGNPHRHPL